MVFLSFLDTNIAFFALGAYNLKFSGYALDEKKKTCKPSVKLYHKSRKAVFDRHFFQLQILSIESASLRKCQITLF